MKDSIVRTFFLVVAALIVGVAPAESQPRTFLAGVSEICGESDLRVLGQQGNLVIPPVESRAIGVSNDGIVWLCGTQQMRTDCPYGTRYVVVRRTDGARVFFDCWR